MANEEVLEVKGKNIKSLPNAMFEVKLHDNGHVVIGYTAGKLKKNRIRVLDGDEVLCSISPYDLKRCRIIFRY